MFCSHDNAKTKINYRRTQLVRDNVAVAEREAQKNLFKPTESSADSIDEIMVSSNLHILLLLSFFPAPTRSIFLFSIYSSSSLMLAYFSLDRKATKTIDLTTGEAHFG
jgi:hypothetical protein